MKLGIENIDKYFDLFKGKRLGLITNPTGVNQQLVSTIDILKDKFNLVALFAPEHGVRGNMQAGVRFETMMDESGIIAYSLYTKDKRPTKEMLDQIDILCIDIQDAGSRFYTYIYTMAYAMMACKDNNKTFVVFDRPNPLGKTVEGNILDINYSSFVGYYPICQRHGMTIGELAKMFNERFEIGCNLVIVPMEGYDRSKYYDELNIPWIAPSPNLPSISSVVAYNGTCIFEGTNISEGRGTTQPFEIVGAPFINASLLAKHLNDLHLPGVIFRPTYFQPTFSKWEGKMCGGVQLHITDRCLFKPVHTGWAMLDVIRNMYPADYETLKPYVEGRPCMLQFNTGCNYIYEKKYTLERQFEIIDKESKEFLEIRKPYLLY